MIEVYFHFNAGDSDAADRLRWATDLLQNLAADRRHVSQHETITESGLRVVSLVALLPHPQSALSYAVTYLNTDHAFDGCGAAEVKIRPVVAADRA
jgi:hypothetical protein